MYDERTKPGIHLRMRPDFILIAFKRKVMVKRSLVYPKLPKRGYRQKSGRITTPFGQKNFVRKITSNLGFVSE